MTIRNPDLQQEEDRVPARFIALVGVTVVAITLLLILWSWLILRSQAATLRPSGAYPEERIAPVVAQGRPVPEGMQQAVFGALGPGEAQHLRGRRALGEVGWANRERGLVRVPIEEAMRRVVDEAGR